MKQFDEDMIYKLHQNRAGLLNLKWTDLYDTEQELIDDLLKVDAFPEGKPAHKIVRGYDYINSFQNRVERGFSLTDKQMVQLKRLAINIAYGIYVQKVVR